MKKYRIKILDKGQEKECPKCKRIMERREHSTKPHSNYFFTEWDYCKPCGHLQHYEQYKSTTWKETEDTNARFQNALFKD